MSDLRFAFRQLRKSPGFTAVVVLTLGLGIGASAAIFSLVNAALLRALPFPNADQLTAVWADNPRLETGMPSLPPANADIAEWRAQNESFANVAAFGPATADLMGDDEPERIGAAAVTAGFFEALGVTPLLGRTLTAEAEAVDGPPVVMIGHGLWLRRFGGDPDLLGKAITINRQQRTVIGILPEAFDFPRGSEWPAFFPFSGRTEIWVPLAYRALDDGTGFSNWQSRKERGLAVVGRLKAGVSLRQAQAEMDAFAARRAMDHPETHKELGVKVISLREQLTGKSQRALMILFASVGLLLVIVWINVANLLFVRGAARHQEIAVRVALGAAPGRLLRQLLTEGVVLALIGGGLGLLMAAACLKVFLALNPVTHSRLDDASLNAPVLIFTLFIALVTSVMAGLVPALRAVKIDWQKSLQEGGRNAGGSVREGVRRWLVGIEVALALVLLTAAGLMVRSFLQVQAVHPGFRPDSVLAFDVNGRPAAFFEQLTARLEALPGVRSAGAISYLPLAGGENRGTFTVEGEPPFSVGNEPRAQRRWVTPGYFATMGISLRQGRVFSATDSADHPKVVVINETMGKKFFGARDPIDRRLRVVGSWRTVVGVVADVKSSSLEAEVPAQLYLPHAQDPWPAMTVVLRAEANPLGLASAVRRELKALDATVPAAKIRTMEQVLSHATSARRFSMALLMFFAGAALLLTMMGIYGVVAFIISQRRREIGIRMALGAQRPAVYWLVLNQGMKPVMAGGAVGLVGSLAVSRLLASQLYGVTSWDPLTISSIVGLLGVAALLACWVPARRAALLDPVEALRHD